MLLQLVVMSQSLSLILMAKPVSHHGYICSIWSDLGPDYFLSAFIAPRRGHGFLDSLSVCDRAINDWAEHISWVLVKSIIKYNKVVAISFSITCIYKYIISTTM